MLLVLDVMLVCGASDESYSVAVYSPPDGAVEEPDATVIPEDSFDSTVVDPEAEIDEITTASVESCLIEALDSGGTVVVNPDETDEPRSLTTEVLSVLTTPSSELSNLVLAVKTDDSETNVIDVVLFGFKEFTAHEVAAVDEESEVEVTATVTEDV